MEYIENILNHKDSEFYILIMLFIFTLWFIRNTIYYYYGEKRKLKHLHHFAKKGDVEAQTHLAEHYHKGKSVKKSCQNAAFWYQKVAFSGNEKAKSFLEDFLEKQQNNKKKKC